MYYLKKDKKEVFKHPLECAVYEKLLKTQPNSTSHAIKHEGYIIDYQETKHEKKYRKLAKETETTLTEKDLNIFKIKNIAELKELARKDEHLNNIPLKLFDNLFNRELAIKHRLSLADNVCIYKQTLLRLANKY